MYYNIAVKSLLFPKILLQKGNLIYLYSFNSLYKDYFQTSNKGVLST